MPINGVIPAIGKHIAAGNALSCGNKSVCTDKPPELRVIIAAVEIVQPGLSIVIVPPVAEGILIAHGVAGSVGDSAFAPGVVGVFRNHLPRGGPDDGDDIPLDIVEVVEQHGPVGKAHALAGAVVDEAHDAVAGLLRQNLAAIEEEFRGGTVDCLAGADTISVSPYFSPDKVMPDASTNFPVLRTDLKFGAAFSAVFYIWQ